MGFEIENGVLVKYHAEVGETDVVIPNGVKIIGNGAFSWCSSLKSITIPESLTAIGFEAFYECKSLESLTIPDSVASIGESAFWGCKSLESVIFNNAALSFNLSALDEILDMIINKNFAVRMPLSAKYRVLCQLFGSGYREAEFYAYFKKNFLKIFKFAIDKNDLKTVNSVVNDGKLLTKQNIDKLTDYAEKQNRLAIKNILETYKNQI